MDDQGRVQVGRIEVEDIGAQRHPLRVFHETDQVCILAFHDGFESLAGLAHVLDEHKPVVLILTCSWYVSAERARFFRDCLRDLLNVGNPAINAEGIILVANSDQEAEHMGATLGGLTVVRSNNSAFVDETIYASPDETKLYDAVLNAKVNEFKRHILSATVENKVFISYKSGIESKAEVDGVNLETLHPKKIFWNISAGAVEAVLKSARVGMMLSAEEGACYASLEYLLCGLPVVSTPSRGGRDDFYDADTAVIVEPSQAAVRAGVETALARLQAGHFAGPAIVERTTTRVQAYRKALNDGLFAKMAELGVSMPESDLVTANIRRGSKFSTTRNFWAKSYRAIPPSLS